MTSITEFNSKPCPQWDASDVNAYFDLRLKDDDKTKLILDNSWGEYVVDLAPAIKAGETITHLMLDPVDEPVYLRFDNEAGASECIHGDDLSRIISMRYLKDVSQDENPSVGDFYVMGADNKFHTRNLSSVTESIGQEIKGEMLDIFYPVGSYYETSDSTFNPNTAWGGTWVEDTAGRVLVSQDQATFSTIGGIGGAETHSLSAAELPAQTGTIQGRRMDFGGDVINTYPEFTASGVFSYASDAGDTWENVATNATNTSQYRNSVINYNNGGQNTPHNNLQPYVVVKRWHRVA